MDTMLLFIIDTLSSDFEQVKSYINHEIDTGKGQWIRTVNDYREKLGISWEKLREMEKKELKLKIREFDTHMWQEEMLQKPSLKLYSVGKKNIGYEICYSKNKLYLLGKGQDKLPAAGGPLGKRNTRI